MSAPSERSINIWPHDRGKLGEGMQRWQEFVARPDRVALSRSPAWLHVLEKGLRHIPYCLEAEERGVVCGILPLAHVQSWLFGGFLVSLPYVNSGGVLTDDPEVARSLIDRAILLADELNVRYLELRHETPVDHPTLTSGGHSKVHMRLALPTSADVLFKQLDGKVRNQVRKGQKNGLTSHWGALDLLPEFYDVFSRNMRDLGTPVYGESFFRTILEQFPGDAELCLVRSDVRAIAGALLLHGKGVTEVPSASSLREFNSTNANMLMYWNLLERAVGRGQAVFDFGRSTVASGTYDFKYQWGARPEPATWQYYLRRGGAKDMRPDNPRYGRLIRVWKRLPLRLTKFLGPRIVRGIP